MRLDISKWSCMMHYEFIWTHIYHLNIHRSRAQLPDIDSRRNGWLMEIPQPFDPPHLTIKWVCDLLGKICNCLTKQKKQQASANRIHNINSCWHLHSFITWRCAEWRDCRHTQITELSSVTTATAVSATSRVNKPWPPHEQWASNVDIVFSGLSRSKRT